MRQIKYTMVRMMLIGIILGTASGFGLYFWGNRSIIVKKSVIIEFPRATKLTDLAESLVENGLIDQPVAFILWTKLFDSYPSFQAGLYKFDEGYLSPVNIAFTIKAGKIYEPIALQFTIPEGFDIEQVIERLVVGGVGSKKQLSSLAKDKKFLKSLNIHSPNLEGYLYPATYKFGKIPKGEEVFQAMAGNFWRNLPKDYANSLEQLGLTLHEAVIFASLIERETSLDEEREKISEVIWRRLKDKVPLGIDAALIYGIEAYKGNITWAHLRDSKNPYNTRIHRGLPPGPICSPTRKSLKAVLNPTNKGYYYYVLKAGSKHEHHFSLTLSEHNKHVKLLVRESKKKKD